MEVTKPSARCSSARLARKSAPACYTVGLQNPNRISGENGKLVIDTLSKENGDRAAAVISDIANYDSWGVRAYGSGYRGLG
jgi:hypothetical protein